IAETPGWPRSSASVEAPRLTDAQGHFELALDPGQYRLDFIPSQNLPRVSRIVTVRPGESTTPEGILPLQPFALSKGRQINGLVSFSGARLLQSPAPYASVRFFRVVNVEGQPSALLLSQTLTSQDGTYSATLPTR
ncbi:MAG TPA: carboxypeptidase regulatory-like domain-containing protein, partial [Myxococcaceae bacterium]|nr:carboxypeptidase regulatory-like domain-containing protein [Myxococcaceae bacterium]